MVEGTTGGVTLRFGQGEGGGGGCASRGTVEEQVRVSAVHDSGAAGDDQGASFTTYVKLHE